METGEWAYGAGEVADRLKDTATSSALAFSAMNVPGTVRSVGSNLSAGRTVGNAVAQDGSMALEDKILEEKRLTAGDSHGSITPYSEISDLEVLLPSGEVSRISKGTNITKIKTFAGKGTKTVYRDAGRLSCLYGGESSEWEKVRGDGYADYEGKPTHCELHWSECSGIGRVKMKVKRWFE